MTPVQTRCERPYCPLPARHFPNVGGRVVDGWQALCCEHVDHFMRVCAATVPTEEAEAGWASWMAAHDAECGALESA